VEVPWQLLTPLGVIDSVPRPMASFWKLENGQWFWYVIPYDPCKGIDAGMFGKLHKQDCVDGKPVNPTEMTGSGKLPGIEGWADRGKIQSAVIASEESVMLSSHKPTSIGVTITNKFEGEVTLLLEAPEMQGLKARLMNNKLASGEATAVEISYDPPAPQLNPEQTVKVRVNPTGQVIYIAVKFDKPPVDLSSGIKSAEAAKPKK
jgi:hypothetical protein